MRTVSGCRASRDPRQRVEQPPPEVLGQQLGRGVGQRQEAAIRPRKDPAAIAPAGLDLLRSRRDRQQRIGGGQQDAVVQLVGDRPQRAADGEEIDDIAAVAQRDRRSRPTAGNCGRGGLRKGPPPG